MDNSIALLHTSDGRINILMTVRRSNTMVMELYKYLPEIAAGPTGRVRET